jgi:fumarate hydratase class II
MSIRIEKDTMGPVEVPAQRYWGAQTQRSKDNFTIGGQLMPKEVISAFAILKKAAAFANAVRIAAYRAFEEATWADARGDHAHGGELFRA